MRAGLRRAFLGLVCVHVPVAVSVAETGPASSGPVGPVNVVLVLLDDVGVDLIGCYEREYWGLHWEHPTPCTPRIDALAAEGVRFTNVWSSPVCSPTRTQIQTGRPPSRSGMGTVTGPASAERRGLDPKIPTLAGLVANDAVVGKWHMADESQWPDHPLEMGFSRFRGPRFDVSDRQQQDGPDYRSWRRWNGEDCAWEQMTRYATAQTADDAIAAIGELDAAGSPWYLYVPFNAPHEPFHCPSGVGDEGCATCEPDWCGTCGASSSAAHRVRAMVQSLDHHLGRLLDAIDPENTAVILLGDNGTPAAASVQPFATAHAKGTLYQGGINVPLIIRTPGQLPSYACHALASVTDLFATIAEFLGVTPPADPSVDSVRLQRWLLPGYAQDPVRQLVHAEIFNPTFRPLGDGLAPPGYRALTHARAVRNERYKLIESYDALGAAPVRSLYRLYSPEMLLGGTPLPHDPAWLERDTDPTSSAFEVADLWPEPDLGECPDAPEEVHRECEALRAALDQRPRLPLGRIAELPAVELRSVGRPLACCTTGRPTVELGTSCSTDPVLVGRSADARGDVENRTFLEFDVSGLSAIAGLTVHALELSVAVASGGERDASVVDVCAVTSDVSDHDTSPAGCASLFRSASTDVALAALASWREGIDLCSPLTRSVSLTASIPALLAAVQGDGRFTVALAMRAGGDDLVALQTLSEVETQADVHELRVTYTSQIGREAIADAAAPGNDASRGVAPAGPAVNLHAGPNPFHPETALRFTLPRGAPASLRIFDVTGALRRTLLDTEHLAPGRHAIPWDGRDDRGRALPSGIYYYRLTVDGVVHTRSTTLLR